MFVILDSKRGKKSLTICPSMDLFKVKEISDCQMAITLTNVRTNSEQTVTPNRIELLTENDLISLQNNSNVFQIMTTANRQRRHNFKAGNFKADYKYFPNIPDHVDQFSNDDFPTETQVNVVQDDPQTTGIVIPDWPLGSTNPEDQSNEIHENANSSIEFQQIENPQINQVPQAEIKYSLRLSLIHI